MSKVKRIIEVEEDTLKFIQSLAVVIIPARRGKTLQKNVIEAIKFSKPYDDSGDLISRSALKEELQSRPFPQDYATTLILGTFKELIDNATTVPLPGFKEGYKQAIIDGKTNFSRPQGEWVAKEDTPASVYYCCSNCDMRSLPVTPYCSWCGAKMKGGADNEKTDK